MSTAQELHKNRQKNGITETVNDFVIKDPSASLQDYYDNILTGANIEQSVLEYRKNMDRVSEEFKKKTGLHAQDVNFLILATLLYTYSTKNSVIFTVLTEYGATLKK